MSGLFHPKRIACFAIMSVLLNAFLLIAAPVYVVGEWKNISPSVSGASSSSMWFFVTFAPGNPQVLYASAENLGVYKSTDGGSSWVRPGSAPTGCDYAATTATFLDCAVQIWVDPDNSDHLFVMDGVRGCTQGFWISTNGAASFVRKSLPAGTTGDITRLAIDPTDFSHMLVGSHQPWQGYSYGGILETMDAGQTFIAHMPIAGFTPGSMGIGFLYEPAHSHGNSRTWIVATESGGYFKTTDAGANWVKVYDGSTAHGGTEFYYASNGTIYSGGYQYPSRSTNNGQTWSQVTDGMPYAYYADVKGDGNNLYACGSGGTWVSSPETDGAHWKPFGTKKFSGGPNYLRIDKTNHIIYAACNTEGVWAIKTSDSPSEIAHAKSSVINLNRPALVSRKTLSFPAVSMSVIQGNEVFDVKGKRIRIR